MIIKTTLEIELGGKRIVSNAAEPVYFCDAETKNNQWLSDKIKTMFESIKKQAEEK